MGLAQARTQDRSVVLASADTALRTRLGSSLQGMRWQVLHAAGGAEAMALLDSHPHEALVLDHWLPDLEVSEFVGHLGLLYPQLDILRLDGETAHKSGRSPRRHELLQAMREAQRVDEIKPVPASVVPAQAAPVDAQSSDAFFATSSLHLPIEGLVGTSPAMRELTALIRIVAPHRSTVLVEGETGTGKELVAHALHALSPRRDKPLAILNCAAIPEALLEAELFGHTRGAFTGAVTARTGRIEAANGGTLFLDEIGEMPLPLQAKMLRFLESGELQRVGDNDVTRVDVRVVAATHRHLERCVESGSFRLDLLHRLAVFPIEVPSLRERKEDIASLSEHILTRLGKRAPRKRLSDEALRCLMSHDWPGNVRELCHVLERAAILARDEAVIAEMAIRLRLTRRSDSEPASAQRSLWTF